MGNSTPLRFLFATLLALLVAFGFVTTGWAQRQPPPAVTQRTGQLTLSGPRTVCLNTAATFTASGAGCDSWSWTATSAASANQVDDPGSSSSSLTASWSATGSYQLTVSANCSGTATASLTVNVVDNTPGTITSTGTSQPAPSGGVTICRGNSLQLNPPANSTNWSWNGACIKGVDGNGVATVQPVADYNTYALTYSPSGSSCSVTSTFVVQVAPIPGKVAAGASSSANGQNWSVGSGVYTFSVQNPNPAYTYNWYDSSTSTSPVGTGTQYSTYLTQSKTYYVAAVGGCQAGEWTAVPALLRNVQLLANGAVPSGPVRLTPGGAISLHASGSGGPYAWFLNGLQLSNQTGADLSATQSGRYTVRVSYNTSNPQDSYAPENESQAVNVVTGLDNQAANGQLLTYVSDTRVLKAGVSTADQAAQLTGADRTQSLSYLTGWAQPLQQVAVQAGPAQEDLVQHFAYAGSTPTSAQTFLPFSINGQTKAAGLYETDPVGKLNAYYAGVDNQPYGTATTEASPLSRPLSQAAAGGVWASHANQVSYAVNTAADGVRQWNGLDGSAAYAAGQLSKQVLVDADGRRTEVYQDGMGRTVLQRKITGYGSGSQQNFDTYSVYAPAGYLQYVIPPAAVVALQAAGTWVVGNLPAGFAGQWLYQYTYDDKGRLAERKFPGADPVYLVYDRADRPVLVQDGTHRKAGQWLFTKFDAQNRPVVSGLYAATIARTDLQSQADNSLLTAEFESRAGGGYSTGNTFPAVQDGQNGAVVLSVKVFDDYDLDQDGSPDYAYATQALGSSPQPVATVQLRGLPTILKTRVVQANGQYGGWLTAVLFYDEYGNLVQKQSNNLLQSGSSLADITTLVYRQQGFVPQVLASLKTQQTAALANNSSPNVSVRNRFTYDAAGRLLQTWQQQQWKNSWDPEVLVSSNTYSGLGELTIKQLHSRDGGVRFLQKVDLAYNLHGQLRAINSSDNLIVSNPEGDLFALDILREQSGAVGNTPRYDGGISAVLWSAHNKDQSNQPERQRSYRFTYDGLGRLTDALYLARPVPYTGWSYEQGAYDEKGIRYDANGNITALTRYSQANNSSSPVKIDDLTFSYSGTGNQHSQVSDAGDASRGFKDATGSGSEYDYDPNGSITRDANKNVTYTYNALNKVAQQTVGSASIAYTYDANGTLLQRIVNSGGGITTVGNKTDYYVDGSVYEVVPGVGRFNSGASAGLLSVPTSEGRALVGASSDTRLTYEYHLRDHLGNLRVAFRAKAGTEDLHLDSENPSQEQGPYPRFQFVDKTQSKGVAAYHGSYVAAVVTSSQAGPTITIPVADRDHLKVRVYYQTPAGVQFQPQAPPSAAVVGAAVGLAVAPTLLPTARPSDGRPAPATPSVQLSVTGLLSQLFTPRIKENRTMQAQATNSLDAYLRWTLLDGQGQTVKSGMQKATVSPGSQSGWTTLDLPYDVDLSSADARTGSLRIEEVNDGSQPVYFDSLTITHPLDKALVTQENHYYPFGMNLSGLAVNTAPVATLSKEQFNEGSVLEDELLGTEAGIYSTFYRSYDPTTGRFTGVDPLADATPNWTVYQFAMANPIADNDPTGALSQAEFQNIINRLWDEAGSDGSASWSADSGGGGGSGDSSPGNNLAGDGIVINRNGRWGTIVDAGNGTAKFVPFNVDNTTPFQVGLEWLTGRGPRHHDFTNGDAFTEMLRQHEHIEETRMIIKNSIAHGTTAGRNPYNLGGLKGVPLYFRDYSTLLTAGHTGNLAVTYLGGYGLTWQVTGIYDDNVDVEFTVTNSSTIESATHPPVIGYTEWWSNTVGQPLNRYFSDGPLSRTTQTFKWTETIKWR